MPPFRFHIEKSGNGGFRPEDKARRLGRRARQAGKFSEIVFLLGGGMLVLLADVRLNDADAGGSALRDGRAGESCNAHEQREAERQRGGRRSEERRVGKECVRTCRYRGWPSV